MRNTLGDLNNHLFAQLERLDDEEMKGEKLIEEINRAKMITGVAQQIISNADLTLRAIKAKDDFLNVDVQMPKMLEG